MSSVRTSQYLLSTIKEVPNDAEIASHQLMIRAGLINKLGAGLYTWMPLGLRVLRKVEAIVREEMDAIGAQEMIMPAVQPNSLWQETGRWDLFGPQLLKMKDRADREYCFGPTHEEVITDFARKQLQSYKQLPMCFYQVQTKFRDEIRPRFGVMRSREFLMKDAYSFHLNKECLIKTYDMMYGAYSRIFTRLGLSFRAVLADTGAIGGSGSHEFHVLADSGEDKIMYCPQSEYAANVELAPALCAKVREAPSKPMTKVSTPGIKTTQAVSEFLDISLDKILKIVLVKGSSSPVIALAIRASDTLHELKLAKCEAIAQPLTLIDEEKCDLPLCYGFLGPKDLNVPIICDSSVLSMSDFVCGANEDGMHFTGMNWERDCPIPKDVLDIREATSGDLSPDGKGTLESCRGIEVGHIFQLGNKYSSAMKATVLDENGKASVMEMGCYGLGVTRVVAAAIEQHHDDKGIIWPKSMVPFDIALVPMNYHKSEMVRKETDILYEQLSKAGYSVILDDRKERPGVMFADMELIGILHRLVVGEKGLANEMIEYKGRKDDKAQDIPKENIMSFLKEVI